MITAKSLSKSYGSLKVLKEIDVSIQKGEIVSIVGASGAGKSTLLHLLGTLDRPDSGEILFEGQKISDFSDKELARFRNQEIGFIFQFHNLLPEFTALENICMPAWIALNQGEKKFSEKEISAKGMELLSILGLAERSHHLPSELSGGEQQRVAVARALINSPSVIFADEPSGNLDSKNAEELHHLFLKLREQFGYTFVIITHNEDLANLADRKLLMQDGRIVF
jgi:lipoprotein-releasing system ATP-binding protein